MPYCWRLCAYREYRSLLLVPQPRKSMLKKYSSATAFLVAFATLSCTRDLVAPEGALNAGAARPREALVASGITALDLGTLGGATSSAMSINNSGQVVGSSTLADRTGRAFIW